MTSGRQLLRALPLRSGLPCITSAFTAPADVERCLTVLAFQINSGEEVEGVDVTGLTGLCRSPGRLDVKVPSARLARLGDVASGWLPAVLSHARDKPAH